MAKPSSAPVRVREITARDAHPVSQFLHSHLNPKVPAAAWATLILPPWPTAAPNHGFQLVGTDGRILGAYVAVYSTRDSGAVGICNLAAFCVLETHRTHSLSLLRALLRQKGYLFTDLSPSGNVPAMNERLGFRTLDVSTRLTLNQPCWSGRFNVTDNPHVLESVLHGWDARVYRDHRLAPAARHALVYSGTNYGYLMYRRDRRKRLPAFASPLYASGDVEFLANAWPALAGHLIKRGFPATLAERRVLGFSPHGLGRNLAHPRPKMYRGGFCPDPSIDYLYSELTLLEW